MELRQLRYFLAVVETGSFSAASAKLRISQPSIGQQVRNLEEELGSPLLLRHSRGVTVTATGEKLAAYALDIADKVEHARRELINEAEEPSGHLRIGMTPSAAAPLAADFFKALNERYPRITVSLNEGLSNLLIEQLDDDRIDIALAFVGSHPEGLRGEALSEEDFHFLVPPDHPDAWRDSITLEEVLIQPLLLPPPDHVMRSRIDALADEMDVEVNLRAVVQSVGTLVNLVENKIGATVLPYSAVARQVGQGRVSAMPIVSPTITRTMSLVYSARRPMVSTELAARKVIQSLVREKIDSGSLKWRMPTRRVETTTSV